MSQKNIFHSEINSIEDFISFIIAIRGKEMDLKTIKQLTEKLSEERTKLADAVKGTENV